MSKRHPWTSFYWDDWQTATAHLNHLEYAIYHRLLTHYYKSQKPLVAIASGLAQLCSAYSEAEQQALASVLGQFFVKKADGYHQKRADEELEIAATISKKRAEVGQKGGLAKARNLVQQNATQPHIHIHTDKAVEGLKVENVERVSKGEGFTETRPPENLHSFNYAAKILEELSFPHTKSNLHAVAAAIDAEVKSGKSPVAAFEFVLAGSLDAKEQGWVIDKFFFEDAKHRIENRSNGHGRRPEQISASAARSERSKRNILDGLAADNRRRAASVQPEQQNGIRPGASGGIQPAVLKRIP
jgi:uncharacterized protein YdaU (DUF1376 family)